jgi:hypothetical protein
MENTVNDIKSKINTSLDNIIPIFFKLNKLLQEIPYLSEIKKNFEDLKIKTNEFRFLRIPILGVIKAGKSSLINSLLRCDILEIGPTIATKFLLIIRYSEDTTPTLWNCNLRKKDLINDSYVTAFETEGSEPVAVGVQNIKSYIKYKNEQMTIKADDEDADLDSSFFMMLKINIPFLDSLTPEQRDIVEIMDCPGLNDSKARLLDKLLLKSILSPYNTFLYIIKTDTCESKENEQTFIDVINNVNSVSNPFYQMNDDKTVYNIILNQIDLVDDKDHVIGKIESFLSQKFSIKYNLIPYSSKQELIKYDYYSFLKEQYSSFNKNRILCNKFENYLEFLYKSSEETINKSEMSSIEESELFSDKAIFKDDSVISKENLIKYSLLWKLCAANNEGNQLSETLLKVIQNQNKKSLDDIYCLVNTYRGETVKYLEALKSDKNKEFSINKIDELKTFAEEFSNYIVQYKNELYNQIEYFKKQIDLDLSSFNDHFFEQSIDKIKESINNLNSVYLERRDQHQKAMKAIFEKHSSKLQSEYKKLNNWCKELEKDILTPDLPELKYNDKLAEVKAIENTPNLIDIDPYLMKTTGYVMGAALLLGSRIILASPLTMLGSTVFCYEFSKKIMDRLDFKNNAFKNEFKECLKVQMSEFENLIARQKEEVKGYAVNLLKYYSSKFMNVKKFLEFDRMKIKENITIIEEVIGDLNKIKID